MLLQNIAQSVAKNHPDVYLIVLLIDERPKKSRNAAVRRRRGDSSTFASRAATLQVAEMVIEKRAPGRAQKGRLDSARLGTRLARAYNRSSRRPGKCSPAVSTAMRCKAKALLGAARISRGGSLTIIATALIDTGSADYVISRSSRHGQMEIHPMQAHGQARVPVDRHVEERQRKEELLIPREDLNRSGAAQGAQPALAGEAMELLLDKMGRPDNAISVRNAKMDSDGNNQSAAERTLLVEGDDVKLIDWNARYTWRSGRLRSAAADIRRRTVCDAPTRRSGSRRPKRPLPEAKDRPATETLLLTVGPTGHVIGTRFSRSRGDVYRARILWPTCCNPQPRGQARCKPLAHHESLVVRRNRSRLTTASPPSDRRLRRPPSSRRRMICVSEDVSLVRWRVARSRRRDVACDCQLALQVSSRRWLSARSAFTASRDAFNYRRGL